MTEPEIVTPADLDTMTAAQIMRAQKDGRIRHETPDERATAQQAMIADIEAKVAKNNPQIFHLYTASKGTK